jgi:glycosyltransferase involved in cell wall biosynthesis
VTHPGLQHSHQLALALQERELLQSFWSGVPIAAPGEALPWWLPEGYRKKIRRVDIPRELRRHPVRFQLIAQIGQAVQPGGISSDQAHRLFHGFDAWAARRLRRLRPKLVVAYENAAYHSFQAAKEIGARCVLDAASIHHRVAAELLGSAETPYTPEINRRKDEEVRLADLIVTCSPLAAESYLMNGVPAGKLRTLILGAEIPAGLPAWQPHAGPPHFVFAGALTRRKSIDILADAFRRLHAEGLPSSVEFVGGVDDPALLEDVRATPGARHTPGVSQQELYAILARADCLLLPSRFDSFGMVVAEAMACGTPAIVSTRTGAKAMIEAFPGSGWVVEPEVGSLHALLGRLTRNPEELAAARAHAQRAGAAFSWASYRARAGQLMEELLA